MSPSTSERVAVGITAASAIAFVPRWSLYEHWTLLHSKAVSETQNLATKYASARHDWFANITFQTRFACVSLPVLAANFGPFPWPSFGLHPILMSVAFGVARMLIRCEFGAFWRFEDVSFDGFSSRTLLIVSSNNISNLDSVEHQVAMPLTALSYRVLENEVGVSRPVVKMVHALLNLASLVVGLLGIIAMWQVRVSYFKFLNGFVAVFVPDGPWKQLVKSVGCERCTTREAARSPLVTWCPFTPGSASLSILSLSRKAFPRGLSSTCSIRCTRCASRYQPSIGNQKISHFRVCFAKFLQAVWVSN